MRFTNKIQFKFFNYLDIDSFIDVITQILIQIKYSVNTCFFVLFYWFIDNIDTVCLTALRPLDCVVNVSYILSSIVKIKSYWSSDVVERKKYS